ncbi:hypothetical protein [Microbacterium sp. cf332]|uniref:hypothetical protein n=1 Tax=Microbacterium sp. cf332 TaxID=1761804 RepID=UPI00088514B7|nr:hypothetical protein [Microbacterium sp. cf332]SDQ88987.1 hypothetical protein SAMN04487847_2887 [Microbacterium sp. cf332]
MSSRILRVAVLSFLLVMVSGCAGQVDDMDSSPSPTDSRETPAPSAVSPTAEPGVTPPPERAALPDCSNLIGIEQVRVSVNDDRVEGPDPLEVVEAPDVLGPAAQDAFDTAADVVGCTYGIPETGGGFSVMVLDIDEEAASELVSALAESDEYEHTTRDEIAMFSKGIPEGLGTYLGYAFADNVWAIVHGSMVGPTTSVNVAADAVAAALARAA